MNRRNFIQNSAAFGLAAATASGDKLLAQAMSPATPGAPSPGPLKVAPGASIPVAFLVSDPSVLIDFAGPWEVLRHVKVPERDDNPFELYTVAETRDPIHADGKMEVVPNYTLTTAPAPKLLIIPAQRGESPAMLEWIRHSYKTADVTMSVCVGAFLLAKTGLLAGKRATTHHAAFDDLAKQYPDVKVVRGARFVDEGNLATSGGLFCGIDLTLHILERYFGPEVAANTAFIMEYQGLGWMDPHSNQAYAQPKKAEPK